MWQGADAAYLVACMWKELINIQRMPLIRCVTDSRSLFEMIQTTKVISDMRLRVDVSRLREMTKLNEIQVEWTEGKFQLADCNKKGRFQ